MKNLLTALGAVVIAAGGSSAALLTNNTQHKVSPLGTTDAYWNDDHSNVEFSKIVNRGTSGVGVEMRKTISAVVNYKEEITGWTLLDSKGFSFSWGDTRYGPWTDHAVHSASLDMSHFDSSKGNLSDSKFDSLMQTRVYSEKKWDGAASVTSYADIGYSWYWITAGVFSFNILVHQWSDINYSFQDGAMFANMGTGVKLYS